MFIPLWVLILAFCMIGWQLDRIEAKLKVTPPPLPPPPPLQWQPVYDYEQSLGPPLPPPTPGLPNREAPHSAAKATALASTLPTLSAKRRVVQTSRRRPVCTAFQGVS